jgi:hypothetical protein
MSGRGSWLLRDGDVLAAIEPRPKGKGWPRAVKGAVLLRSTVFAPAFTGPVSVDLAWCVPTTLDGGSPGLRVRRTRSVLANRVVLPRLTRGAVVVAPAGSFERWRLHVGDRLEVREV